MAIKIGYFNSHIITYDLHIHIHPYKIDVTTSANKSYKWKRVDYIDNGKRSDWSFWDKIIFDDFINTQIWDIHLQQGLESEAIVEPLVK